MEKETVLRLKSICLLAVIAALLGWWLSTLNKPVSTSGVKETFIWSVEPEELEGIEISLPFRNLKKSWLVDGQQQWRFDEPDAPIVDSARWGQGIPLLLSGPRATRRIAVAALGEELEQYGLAAPRMMVNLSLAGSKTLGIVVGGTTPSGRDVYVKLRADRVIYTVPTSWSEVLERLVVEPPYLGR